jgi:hypothetical protein
MTTPIQNVSARNTQKVLKDKGDAKKLQALVIAQQQDIANLWAAINNLTLQLDYVFNAMVATSGFTFTAFNPVNGGGVGTGFVSNAANVPQTNNDQVASTGGLVYNNTAVSSLHTQP